MTAAREALLMIVEDDPDTRDALGEILSQAGYRTVGAANGKEALSQLRSNEGDLPCVILLDITMPEMDGWEFRRQQHDDPVLCGAREESPRADPHSQAMGLSGRA